MAFRAKKQPTRYLKPHSPALPAYGPEASGLTPRVSPSIYCSWCGSETNLNSDVKICPVCDVAPPYPQTTKD